MLNKLPNVVKDMSFVPFKVYIKIMLNDRYITTGITFECITCNIYSQLLKSNSEDNQNLDSSTSKYVDKT